MLNEIICAGFGGQGVLTVGKLLIFAAFKEGLNLTWIPSYGNEMRGGTANCNVVISDAKIASPYAKHPGIVIAMNQLSVDRFLPLVKAGGVLFVNSSIVEEEYPYDREDITIIKVPATEMAQKLGTVKGANIFMAGAVIRETKIFKKIFFADAMCQYFEEQEKGQFNVKNREMFYAGYDF